MNGSLFRLLYKQISSVVRIKLKYSLHIETAFIIIPHHKILFIQTSWLDKTKCLYHHFYKTMEPNSYAAFSLE